MEKDYKKLYEDLRGKIQNLHDRLTGELREVIEEEVPETKKKEPSDEEIRKEIIEYINREYRHTLDLDKKNRFISWLEKQIPPKWLYRLEYKDGTCGLWYNGEGKWCFEQGIGSIEDCKTKDLPMDHDERYKQDGRDWFSSCSRKEDLMHWYSLEDAKKLIKKGFVFTRYLATEYHEYEQETVFIKDTALVREEIDIFSLFGKTKPKFKEGDWIIYRDEWTKEVDVLMVSNPDPKGTSLYTVKGEQKYYLGWDSLKSARLWKLDDAIPGDILSYRNGQWIFIYEGMGNEPITIKYYVLLSDKGIETNNYCETTLTECIKPASKKERDLLFTKLKKTGYWWDEKVKKLVNSTLKEKEEIDSGFTRMMNEAKDWSEEDKENYKQILTHLECQGNSATLDVNRKKWRELESWFKRRIPILPKREWNEEDEKLIDDISGWLTYLGNLNYDGKQKEKANEIYKAVEKLKLLFKSYQWKPNEEQLKALSDTINYITGPEVRSRLSTLYEQLKEITK